MHKVMKSNYKAARANRRSLDDSSVGGAMRGSEEKETEIEVKLTLD